MPQIRLSVIWSRFRIMFTGIIRNIGEVNQLSYNGPLAKLQIETSLDVSDVEIGDSIAVNGVCLTIVEKSQPKLSLISFDLGPETLESTALSSLRIAEKVHLEKAMQLSERINGHLVQGHVDGIGIVVHKEFQGDALIMKFAAPQEILRSCIKKGSIAADGVSLTINKVHSGSLEVCLIPHTLVLTNFTKYDIGRRVNLETDMIGKYVYEVLHKPGLDESEISWELLSKNGFLPNDSEVGNSI